jgi:hypothetical protein
LKDKTFRTRLLANPTLTLIAAGVDIPVGVTVKVVENTATEVYMVLPDSGDDQLSDVELERVAAGAGAMEGGRSEHPTCTIPWPERLPSVVSDASGQTLMETHMRKEISKRSPEPTDIKDLELTEKE